MYNSLPMICPTCKCEYRAGVTKCTDCDVSLVDSLDAATSVSTEADSIVSIWYGDDPREFALVKNALDKAGIPFLGPVPTGYFILPSTRPKMQVAVSSADRERAEKVMLEVEPMDDDPDELVPEEREALAIPESEGVDFEESAGDRSDFPEDWEDNEAVSEVWNGDEEQFANNLMAFFRENGIQSHKVAEGSHWRIVVRSQHEARAKGIVREVVEGVPPE